MHRIAKRAVAGLVIAAAGVGGLLPVLPAQVASAAGIPTGIAKVSPSTGSSVTAFTLKVPANAACTGDSTDGGFNVTSYMVPASVNPADLVFDPITGPVPNDVGANLRQPLYEAGSGSAYTGRQTAQASTPNGPGPIINIPQFDLSSAGYQPGNIPAGVYNLGIACVKGTVLYEYWNARILVTTDVANGGPAQVRFRYLRTPVADFNRNGSTEVAVFRPTNGVWYANGLPAFQYGTAGDIPVPGDYDGDGDSDFAVFRPSTNVWFVNGQAAVGFGEAGDIPVPGDYDGDGDTDIAVFRPSNSVWFIFGQGATGYGATADVPVPADYDGDGDTDLAVFRPSTNVWHIFGQAPVGYGETGDVPVPGDFDGDGDADAAMFRPSTNVWFVNGMPAVGFGEGGDVPVPGDYDGDGDVDIATFRPSTNVFFINGQSAVGYGEAGDRPVAARPSLP